MPDALDMSHYAVTDRPLSRETHIRLALVRLFTSEHLNLGYLRDRALAKAAEHLEAAGMPELAMRCLAECDGNGSDIAAIERDVKAAAEGDARPA